MKRSIVSVNAATVLREPRIPYNTVLGDKNDILSPLNGEFLIQNALLFSPLAWFDPNC